MQEFSTANILPSHQSQKWQQYLREVYYDLVVKCDKSELRGKLTSNVVGTTNISQFDSDAQQVFRTTETVRAAPDDSYVIVFPVRGDLFFDQKGRQGVVRNGGYVMVSSGEYYELSCSSSFLNLTVKIQGEKLRQECPNIDDHTSRRFNNNSLIGQELLQYCKHVNRIEAHSNPQMSNLLERALTDLALAMLIGEQDSQLPLRSAQALKERFVSFIRENYADTDLTPQKIAEEMGISKTYLYRVVGDTDKSVSGWLMDYRLQRAHEMLVTRARTMPIKRIAYECGFKTASHFSQSFRRKYGVTPKESRK